MALPRSATGKALEITEMPTGNSSEAPIPCTNRAAMSISADCDAPHSSDENPLAPEQVAEPAAGDEEGRQRELVDGDGPLQVGGGDVELARGRRQGEVEREEVDVDAEDGQCDRRHDAALGRCPQPCPFSHTARHPARDATGMNH